MQSPRKEKSHCDAFRPCSRVSSGDRTSRETNSEKVGLKKKTCSRVSSDGRTSRETNSEKVGLKKKTDSISNKELNPT